MRGGIIVALLLAPLLAGCMEPFRVHVPEPLLDGSPHEWVESLPRRSDGGTFGLDEIETVYRFTGESGGPFPAMLYAIGLQALTRISDDKILDQMEDILATRLRDEGLEVDADRQRSGERTLPSGVTTQWILLTATSAPGGFFSTEEEVRAFAETWYDGRSSTNVVAVALAQTTGSGGLFGSSTIRDESVWAELVGDSRGSVQGTVHESGFIVNLVTHG